MTSCIMMTTYYALTNEQLDSLAESIAEKIYEGRKSEDVLVSCIEAARLLGRTPNTVTRMLREGRLHRVTIGDSTGIRLSEIDELR